MIIFEKPFVSDELAAYAATTQTPVLDNAFSREMTGRFDLRLLDDRAFADGIAAGGRLYTTSENALDWVYRNVRDASLLDAIRLMKDKHALRTALKPMYPDYMFLKVPVSDLPGVDVSALTLPFVLKPSVGFYSMGVYTITSKADWNAALDDIDRNMAAWTAQYPASVLGETDFLLEAFIRGEEYAVDVYFNETGEAVIVNIMKHDFTSDKDVSDRLYYTSKVIIEQRLAPFTRYFNAMNRLLGARNVPAHIEIRVAEDGTITPIECNPMRFSGWCTTDLADFAFGIKTYDCYLNNRVPDWNAALSGKDGQIFSFVILDKPSGEAASGIHYDYNAVSASFTKVLHLRRMEKPEYPMFGLVFTQTPSADRSELDRIMRSDLTEYMRAAS